jgi:hypothetical protein
MMYINACLGYLYDMIDLLKQYVDGGAELTAYQIDKLPRSLFITFMRRLVQNEDIYRFDEDELASIGKKLHYLSDDKIKEILNLSPSLIQYIENQTEDLKSFVLKKDISLIKYIKNPPKDAEIAAVTKDVRNFKYINNPSEDVQIAATKAFAPIILDIMSKGIVPSESVQVAAVSKLPSLIKKIINNGIEPTENVQLAAVKKEGYAIQLINNPTEKVQLAAIKNNIKVFKFIENPYPSVIKLYNLLTND